MDEENEEIEKLRVALNCMKNEKLDMKIIVTHWAPFKNLVIGEKVEFYPLFGNSKMGDEILKVKSDLILSGHSHKGKRGIKEIEDEVFACNISYEVNNEKLCLFTLVKMKIFN